MGQAAVRFLPGAVDAFADGPFTGNPAGIGEIISPVPFARHARS